MAGTNSRGSAATVVAERQRLGHMLHDGVLQELTALNLQLEAMARRLPAAEAEALRSLAAGVRGQQAGLRLVVETLMADAAEPPGGQP